MRRVGVITTSFPRWRGDFAGAFVEDAVRALAATRVGVDVLAAGDAGGRTGPGSACADGGAARATVEAFDPAAEPPAPRIRVHRLRLSRPPPGAPPLFYGPGAPEALERGGVGVWLQAVEVWGALCQAIRALAPGWSRIEAHWLVPCGLAARLAAPQLPLSIRVHSGDVALLERLPGGRWLARRLAAPAAGAGAPAFTFVTADLKARFARLAGAEVGSVSAATVSAFETRAGRSRDEITDAGRDRTRARHALGLDAARRTVLSVGRLVPIKGYDVLLRAIARASSSAVARPTSGGVHRPTVVIVGDGPERARLTDLARRLDIDLRLPGFVRRDQIAIWLAGADVYVQPSVRLPTGRTEGLPTATLEALAAGLPVVASATGGLTELPFGPPRLRLVPPGDAAALAACLEL